MKKILLTLGPIPARLDAVKFLTNRFKGGLALKTAHALKDMGHDVHLIAWKYTEIETELPITRIDDVMDYYRAVLEHQADAYILAAAVANLMPSQPYEGKFPSHLYHVGEKFQIEFEIAPRVIDEIKKKYPRSALIGYKLLDGDDQQLIDAGHKTLFESRANVVFANHPAWAKEKKIVLTQDGAVFEATFDEHIQLIDRLVRSTFYSTTIQHSDSDIILSNDEETVLARYPRHEKDGRIYGTFAVKRDHSFITTTRGKQNGSDAISEVFSVNHRDKIVCANRKATLNAPLLDAFFQYNPHFSILIHGHDMVGRAVHPDYEWAGSDGDIRFATQTMAGEMILLPHHGYIVGFETIQQFIDWHNNFMTAPTEEKA